MWPISNTSNKYGIWPAIVSKKHVYYNIYKSQLPTLSLSETETETETKTNQTTTSKFAPKTNHTFSLSLRSYCCLCMAVSLLTQEVSDLCLGKPALRCLSVSATIGDALSALKRLRETYLSVWTCNHDHDPDASFSSKSDDCVCIGKICMVDIICFLCRPDCLKSPTTALNSPLSVLIPRSLPGLVTHLEPHARFVSFSIFYFFLDLDLLFFRSVFLICFFVFHNTCVRGKLYYIKRL